MDKHGVVPQVFLDIPDYFYQQLPGLQEATIYHQKAWHNFLRRTFGWQISALAIVSDNQDLRYFLPFVSKFRLGSTIKVSLPLSHHVGPAVSVGFSSKILSIPGPKIPFEIHDKVELPFAGYSEDNYISILDLNPFHSLEELFSSFSKSSIQRKISKAQNSHFEVTIGTNPDDLNAFFHLQSLTRWRQGSPTYPQGFFRIMGEELSKGGNIQLYLLKLDNRPVSGIIFLFYGDKAIYGYGASIDDRSIWQMGANQLVMWEAIQDAVNRGCQQVDFGKTPKSHSSLLSYKEKWGTRSSILTYTHINHKGNILSGQRESGGMKMANWVLRHTPYPIYKRLSPLLLRQSV